MLVRACLRMRAPVISNRARPTHAPGCPGGRCAVLSGHVCFARSCDGACADGVMPRTFAGKATRANLRIVLAFARVFNLQSHPSNTNHRNEWLLTFSSKLS